MNCVLILKLVEIIIYKRVLVFNRPRPIYQYSNMAPRLSGQNCKFFKFVLSLNSQRDLDTKKTQTNVEVCPESLEAMLEY